MPWLAMTAFVHSIMVQKRRGMFRMWNIVLIVVAFTLAQMGMFINRGGPVPSVHSFAQSAMGWIFLSFMVGTLALSMAAFVWRMDTLKSRERLDSLLSRESAFLVQNVLFSSSPSSRCGAPYFQSSRKRPRGRPSPSAGLLRPSERPPPAGADRPDGRRPAAPVEKGDSPDPLCCDQSPRRRRSPHSRRAGRVRYADPVALLAFAVCGAATAGIVTSGCAAPAPATEGGGLPRRLRPPPVGEQAALRGLHRPYRYRPAGGGRRGVLLLRRPEGHRSASGRRVLLRRLHLPIPGPRRLAPPGQAGGVRRCRAASRRPLSRRRKAVPGPFYPDFNIASTRGAIRSTPIEDFYIVHRSSGTTGRLCSGVMVNQWSGGCGVRTRTRARRPLRPVAPAPAVSGGSASARLRGDLKGVAGNQTQPILRRPAACSY